HVTGLLRNGATLAQAKELARHADVRMTMKYTHIGLDDQAKALSGLPVPLRTPSEKWSEMGREIGGASCQSMAADGKSENRTEDSTNAATPSIEGVASPNVACFQEKSVDVSIGGGGNCTRRYVFASHCGATPYKNRFGRRSKYAARLSLIQSLPDCFGTGNQIRSLSLASTSSACSPNHNFSHPFAGFGRP
ncbi:MAG: hypothetical protein ACKO85_12900, partial [Isosphaeraceae bacterium]